MANQRWDKPNPELREFPAVAGVYRQPRRNLQPRNVATPSALPIIQKCSIARSRQDGKQSLNGVAPEPAATANRAIRSLSVARSTGKLTSKRRHPDRNASTDPRPCSTVFKRNYAMLGVVFAGGFAFEMCVHPSPPTR